VYYELLCGLIKVDATGKLHLLEANIIPMLRWEVLTRADWVQGARYWAEATKHGRQFSDIDLLIAAIATRLDAVIVSSDTDFDALPVKRENWREPSS
jgi:predicted nucleic acid-binding protein